MRSTHLSNLLSTNGYSVPLSDKSHIRGYNSRTCHLFLLTSLPMSNPQAGPPVHSRIRTHCHTTQLANCDLKKKRNLRFPPSPLLSTQRNPVKHCITKFNTGSPFLLPKFWNVSFTTRYGESVHTVYECLLRLIISQTACVISRRRSRRNRGGRGKGGKRGPRPPDNGSRLSSSARCR